MKLNDLHENLPGGPLGGQYNRYFDLIINLPNGETVRRNRLEQYSDFHVRVWTPEEAARLGYKYSIMIMPSQEKFNATDYQMLRAKEVPEFSESKTYSYFCDKCGTKREEKNDDPPSPCPKCGNVE